MKAIPIQLSLEERGFWESWVRNGKTEQRLVLRARIILAAAQGEKNIHLAQNLGVS